MPEASPGEHTSNQSKACLPKTSVNVVVIFTVDDDKLVGGNSLVVVIVVEEVVLVNVVGEFVDVEGSVTDVVPLVLILVVVVFVVGVLVVAAVVVVDVGIITGDVRAELVNGFSDETLQVLQQRLRRYESRQSIEEQFDT